MVTILCGGPGLGFYVPGAILARRLRGRRPTELTVIEGLLPPEKQERVRRSRQGFHKDFRFALMAQRLARDISGELEPALVEALLLRWQAERRREFVVFSGFWAGVVTRYIRGHAEVPVRADFCHVDSAVSPSWGLTSERPPGVADVWFLRWEERCLCYRLDVTGAAPVPWAQRNGRFLVHGGGWGVGTYRERARELEPFRLPLDLLYYERAQAAGPEADARRFLLDPAWFPFVPGAGLFPPLAMVAADGTVYPLSDACGPPLFELTRDAAAIISKPGGGTLIDSLAAATPLVLLEPCGEYERKNGLLWQQLGFAVPFAAWIESGCSRDLLRPLHENLLAARTQVPDYAEHLCESGARP